MKVRILAGVLAMSAALCVLLAACGPRTPAPSSDAPAENKTTAAAAPETEAPETEAPQTTDPTTDDTQPEASEPDSSSETPAQPQPEEPEEPEEPDTSTDTPPAASGSGEAIASLAKSLVGTTYLYGAAGPTQFDNSGFIYYCLTQNGISAPRRTGDLAAAGTAVEKDALQPGDIVFFHNDTPGVPQYAGIYIGDHQFVSCNNEESPTKIQDMSLPYFVEHYVTARRFV